ncbi:titin homolog [Myripristis murdjan]|uniref:Titin homolog n=1 Tax=Myripristis murdjan TaxID=586833 RepID=A0A667ZVC1_9TELE|nr:titin homolog [Myripristis murdjan]
MAAQVEVQTGEVGRTGVGGRLHLSPLTDSSNKSLIEGPSSNQGSLIVTPEPNKPVPTPKPRLTPKPFAVEKNPTIRPILAPKPQTKLHPEPTRPTGYKPDLPSTPKPQQPVVSGRARPVSTNPNRPAPTSFKPSPKLNTGQTTKPVVQPFKPAPPLTPENTSKPNPPQPAERQKPGTLSSPYARSPKKPPAAEWSGTTKKEEDTIASSKGPGGTSMTRAKSMGFLLQVGQDEEEKQQNKAEAAVPLRPQPRGSRTRPVSAIYLPSPNKTEPPSPAPRWAGRRPLSADLTSKFESIGLSLHRKPPKANSKENTPEERRPLGRRETEKDPDRASTTLQGADGLAKPAVSDQDNMKKEEAGEKDMDEEKGGGSIKRRISLLLDSSSSPGAGATGQKSEPQSSVQPVPEGEPPLGVKQRIKQLTEDPPPAQSPPVRPTVKPRPLPLDLTKRFTPERSTDRDSPTFSEATDRHESDKDPQRTVEESASILTDQKKMDQDIRDSQVQITEAVEQSADATPKEGGPGGAVLTVRASLFENVVERHSVLVVDEDQHKHEAKSLPRSLPLKRGDGEDEGTLVTATYREPVSPSSPLRVLHSFDTVPAVQESRAVSKSIPVAQLEEKAMTLRSRRSEENRPAPTQGEPVVGLMPEQQQPRYLRVGALQKWTADLEQEAGIEEDLRKDSERDRQMALEKEREQQRDAEMEEAAAAPKRLKMLEMDEPPKPRATYFALTGQIQEPGNVEADRGDVGVPFDDFSVRSGHWSSQGKVVPLRRNPSLEEAFIKSENSIEKSLISEKERELAWDRQVTEGEMEVEKHRELNRETERQRMRLIELEREKQRQHEAERQAHLEFARMKEREMQREYERQKKKEKENLRELEKQKQQQLEKEKQQEVEREREKQRQLERERLRQLERERQRQLEKERRQLEKERQRELEMERQREMERERLRELEREKERQQEQERQRKREQERQKELDKERRLLELQKERQRAEELERIQEMERRQLLEFERQKQKEKERQQLLELEKQRLREKMEREEAEKIKQMAIQQEVDRHKELERQRAIEKERCKELERERQRELERQKQRDLERERQKQLDLERQELENQRIRQRELEKEKQRKEELERMMEIERRKLAEFEKQKQVERERERQQLVELEKQRLRDKMMREEAEKLRQVAKQQEAERQRLKEKQRKEQQERMALDSSPLRPKVLDLDSVLRDDSFSKATPQHSDPATRWRQVSPRADELYKPAILDIDSFTTQTQPSPSKDMFPVAGIQVIEAGSGSRSQPLTPETDSGRKLTPESSLGRPSPTWTVSLQDPWELRPGEMSVDRPPARAEPLKKPANKLSVEQFLLRHEDMLLAPERRWSGVPDQQQHSSHFSSEEPKTANTPMEQIWLPREPERCDNKLDVWERRSSQGAQELNRMRSRSVSRRSAPSSSAVEANLSRMRSRSAHRERDRHSWVQQKQSVSSDKEEKHLDTPVHDTDSQYGTWETGLRTDDSLSPATPTSDSNLTPSPRKPTPPHTPGEYTPSLNLDTPDGLSPLSPPESQPFPPLPDVTTTLLDTSALRSRAQLAKKRGPRSRPSRAAHLSAAVLPEGEAGATEDWRYRDSTEEKVESKQEDSDSEEQARGVDPRSAAASQPQRVALFPGMDPSALKAQLKKRGDSDNQTDGPAPSASQLSRSPKSPFLPRAARVLPPTGGKENGEDSPQWLRELKTKKRLSQIENDS